MGAHVGRQGSLWGGASEGARARPDTNLVLAVERASADWRCEVPTKNSKFQKCGLSNFGTWHFERNKAPGDSVRSDLGWIGLD